MAQKIVMSVWVVICIIISAVYAADHSPSSTLVNDIEMAQVKQFEKHLNQKNSDAEVEEALKKAIVTEDSAFLKAMLKKKEIAAKVKDNAQYIQIAVQEGTLLNLKLLVPSYNDLSVVKMDDGTSLLQSAVQYSNLETVKYLVEKAPKLVTFKDNDGENVVFAVARRGKKDIAEYVLGLKGIDTKLKNKKDQTASDVAEESGFPKLAKRIKEAK